MKVTDSGSSRRWLTRASVIGMVILAAVLLRFTVLAPDPVEVRVVAVENGLVESTVTNSKAGTVRARRRARVTAEIGGRVVSIHYREGERVEKDAVLVRLNDVSHVAQLEVAMQGVQVAAAHHDEACLGRDRAARELDRKKRLSEQAIVSVDLLDQLQFTSDAAKVACRAAAAEHASSKTNVRAAEAELLKTQIRAPFSGVIAEVSIELGEWVTPSPPLLTSPAVVDLIDSSSLYVSAPMDEVDSGRIRAGQRVKVSIDSHPGKEFQGQVVRVAPYVLDIEAQNRTVEVEIELILERPDISATFLPGTSADVEIVLEERTNVLRVPTSALLEGNRVLVLNAHMLEERAVELGLRNWEYAELTSGLSSGERVVVSLDRVEVKAGVPAVEVDGDTERAS
jgi:HlyD family secretion protein